MPPRFSPLLSYRHFAPLDPRPSAVRALLTRTYALLSRIPTQVCAEGEYVLYSIVILRGQYEAGKFEGDTFVPGNNVDYVEPLKHAFRDKRYIVREFNYDAAKSGGLDGQISAAASEVQQVHQTIVRWCQAHYGEAYSGWIHLKVRALLCSCAAFFSRSAPRPITAPSLAGGPWFHRVGAAVRPAPRLLARVRRAQHEARESAQGECCSRCDHASPPPPRYRC